MKKYLKKKGFTLIELLIALVTGIIVIEAAYVIYLLQQKYYRKSDVQAELSQNARVALDRISRELRQTGEIVTLLPAEESEPPASEITFEDGHTSTIQYITYYLSGPELRRKLTHYYFETNPDVWVSHNAKDGSGNLPSSQIDEDRVIAENISNLGFYGEKTISILLTVSKQNQSIHFKSQIFARNL